MGKLFVAVLLAASWAMPLAAGDVLGARGFVAHIYVKKTNDRHFDFASPRILTADLYALAQANAVRLNYDPLFQCRSNDGLSAQIVSVSGNDKRAIARMLLRFDADRLAPPQRLALILTRAPLAGWKIADIQSSRIPSLKAWLEKPGGASGRPVGVARRR